MVGLLGWRAKTLFWWFCEPWKVFKQESGRFKIIFLKMTLCWEWGLPQEVVRPHWRLQYPREDTRNPEYEQNQLWVEKSGMKEPFRPRIHKTRRLLGCGEWGRERTSGIVLVPVVCGDLDQERRQGEQHVLKGRWKVKFQTLCVSGMQGTHLEMGRRTVPPSACGAQWLVIDTWLVFVGGMRRWLKP